MLIAQHIVPAEGGAADSILLPTFPPMIDGAELVPSSGFQYVSPNEGYLIFLSQSVLI